MKFQYFTYLLNPVNQSSLFGRGAADKNEIFNKVLVGLERRPFEYSVGHSKLAFVVFKKVGNYLVARLGKRSSLKRNLPPEKAFEETREENWPHCTIIFNLNTDPEKGQKILFELKRYVFPSPGYELKRLAEALNGLLLPSGYAISINPVTIEQEFWKTVTAYGNKIEKITFTFDAPNLFNLNNSLEEELKEVRKDYGATKATVEFENPDGNLKVPENTLTRQSVDYIARGGGEYRLRIKGRNKTIISSKGKIKTKEIYDEEIEIALSNQKELFSLLDKIFE